MSQLDMFGASAAPVSLEPTPDSVRARIEAILNLLGEAQEMPWSEDEFRSWRVVVPQMARWLPEGERDAVKARFEAEVRRLAA